MKTEICIRPFQRQDHDGVVSLWNLVFPNEPAWNESNALIRTKLTQQPELFFVALYGDEVVGTVMAGFDGVRGWVHKVAAHPDHQRKRIAAQLMHHAESALRELGCVKLNLQVREGNQAAMGFYESQGYSAEDRVSYSKHL